MSGYYNRNNRGITKKLGPVTAYADAVLAGYTGTREQWAQDMAKLGQNVTQVAQNTKLTTELAEQTRVNTEQVAKDTADVRRLAEKTSDNAVQVASNTAESNRLAEETKQAAAQAKADAEYAGAAADNFRVDTTLSEAGKAAEAKATGEKFAQLSEEIAYGGKISSIHDLVMSFAVKNYSVTDQAFTDAQNRLVSENIGTAANDLWFKTESGYKARIIFFDDNDIAFGYSGYVDSGKILAGQRFRILIKKDDNTKITLNEKFVIYDDVHAAVDSSRKYSSEYIVDNPNNKLALEDAVLNETDSNAVVYIKDNKIYVSGDISKNNLILKISNGYDLKYGNDTAVRAVWATERVDWLIPGSKYCVDYEYEVSNGVAFSVRDANSVSLLREQDNPTSLGTNAAYIMLHVPAGSSLLNFECSAFIENASMLTGRKVLSGSVHVPELDERLCYKTIESFKHEIIHQDEFEQYGAVQGMCTYGNYIYYSIVSKSDADNTMLCKYSISDGVVTLTVQNRSYGHANGMAYIPSDNVLYICHMDTVGTVSRVNAETLEYIDEFSLYDVLSPVVPWYKGVGAVAYDTAKEKIVFLLRGSAESDGRTRKGFAVFDKEMRFEKIIKTEYIPCDSYSGICTDENHIYLGITNPSSVSAGEWLVAYDWHGNEVYRVKLTGYTHFEAPAKLDENTFVFADNRTFTGATLVRAAATSFGAVSKIDVLCKYNLN